MARLVVSADLQEGFKALRDSGNLKSTFEALVVRFDDRFDPEVVVWLAAARPILTRRLGASSAAPSAVDEPSWLIITLETGIYEVIGHVERGRSSAS